MAVKQTAGRDQLGDFAPEFAQLKRVARAGDGRGIFDFKVKEQLT